MPVLEFLGQTKQLLPRTTASVSPQAPKHKEGWQQASSACTLKKGAQRQNDQTDQDRNRVW